MAKGSFCLRGGFPAGTKVEIRERVGDNFSQALKLVKTAKVSKDSVLEVDGLELGPYFVAAVVDGELRVRAATAKPGGAVGGLEPARHRADGSAIPNPIAAPELSPSLRSQREDPEIVTGVKTTRTRGHVPPSDRLALEHQPDSQGRQDGIPSLGEKGAPKQLASDTFAGQAIAATPPGGRLQQDEVPKGTPQASDTEAGDAAVIVEVSEPPLGDHDPFRASGDSAIGPAGTVSPDNQGDKSTTRVRRDAEKAAARKSPNAKRRPSRAQQERKVERTVARAEEKRAEKGPGDLTPGTNPLAGDPPAPPEKAAPNRGERSTSRAKPATTKTGKPRKKGAKQAVVKDAQKQATAKSRGRS